MKKPNVNFKNPTQQQLNNLLQKYQNKQFSEAEKIATSIAHEFPKYQFAWKILGLILFKLGKISEAVNASQTAITLSPKDPEAYNNLGVLYIKLNKFNEAEKSYRQAIKLKPDFAESYYNLGGSLTELGRFNEAEKSYRQAIKLKPDYVNAYSNLGNTLTKLGRLDEAEKNYKKSIEVDTEFINLVNFINIGDWISSKEYLEKFCLKKINIIKNTVKLFIELWCIYCEKLLIKKDLRQFIKIFTKLIIIGERDQNIDRLINFLFSNFDLETIIRVTDIKDRVLINLSYCQHKFFLEKFDDSNSYVQKNIQDSVKLIQNIETKDLGWFVVRRSLTFCKDKKISRKILDNLITNIVLVK